jgi:hypothetical protein
MISTRSSASALGSIRGIRQAPQIPTRADPAMRKLAGGHADTHQTHGSVDAIHAVAEIRNF